MTVDDQTIRAISQQRFNCLGTKRLHAKRLTRLRWRNRTIDFLAIGVPAFYFAFRFSAKGTRFEVPVEIVWVFLATLLLVLAILRVSFQWPFRAEKHSELLGRNISLAGQAANLLSETDRLSPESARLFFLLTEQCESEDTQALGELHTVERQWAFREAVKESGPAAVCLTCSSSPWKFVPGTCQTCGNTPSPN